MGLESGKIRQLLSGNERGHRGGFGFTVFGAGSLIFASHIDHRNHRAGSAAQAERIDPPRSQHRERAQKGGHSQPAPEQAGEIWNLKKRGRLRLYHHVIAIEQHECHRQASSLGAFQPKPRQKRTFTRSNLKIGNQGYTRVLKDPGDRQVALFQSPAQNLLLGLTLRQNQDFLGFHEGSHAVGQPPGGIGQL